jgi:P4 family phage/plasmid primase-like protien
VTVNVRGGVNSSPFTATVTPAPAPAPVAVETGFGDLDGTPSPVQHPAPTVNTEADTGEDPDVDLDALVAGLLPNKSTTNWNEVQAFIGTVVPWPGEQDPGFVNLHFSNLDRADPTKLHKGGGWPFRAVDGFVSKAAWIPTVNFIKDAWFCLSLQSQTKPNKNNPAKPRAHRLAANAISLKAIWIDIDVGPKKLYATLADATKAVLAFCAKHKLPTPSAMVNSGSGLHVYWISKDVLDPQTWSGYAHGLHALLVAEKLVDDPGLTTDAARILRIPGTFNHKTTPPLPVNLFKLPLVLYDFPTALALLPTLAPAAATLRTQTTAEAPASVFFDDAAQARFKATKQAPIFAGLTGHLHQELLPATPIFRQCGFLRHALQTNGADYDNPLWHLSVLCSTFMENGNVIAHAISSGHSKYDKDKTQALYDRKMVDRRDRGIGYPRCGSIQGNGCTACATCPHFGKITSPLKLGMMRPEPNQGDGTAQQTPNSGAGSGDERLVVPKDDHMGRARIYRNTKRPNLYHYRDDYYDHEAGHYTIIDDATIRADLYEFLDHCDKKVPCKGKPTEPQLVSFAPNKSSVSETGEALKAIGHVVPTVEQPHWLDGRAGPDPTDLICFPNGILNINSNQFTPPDPTLFTPHGVGFDYDPNAAAPIEWLNFLDQVFNGEIDQINALQEMFGYCLSSDVSQEKVFMVLGDKRSGKDTIRHTLQSLLSPTVICGPTLDSMGTNFGMSQLIGKQVAVVGDMRLGTKCDKDLLAEHVLKLSGRGLFTIDRKHKSHWTGPLPCKLLLISNEMPKLKDASGALASRIITFRTRNSFYGREDRHLFDNKIKPELPAILLWALDGLRRMRQTGPIAEPACSIETREELAREGSPIMAFVQECLTLNAAAVVDKNAMYSTYLDFAHDHGLPATSKSWFFRDLDTATASKVKAVRVQNGGIRVHNVVGASISNPPPKRPKKNEPIVILTPAPTPAAPTAEDVGKASEDDVALDEIIKNSQTSQVA